MSGRDLYVRYYVGSKGRYGRGFLEFEFRADGKVCVNSIVPSAPVRRVSGTHQLANQIPTTCHPMQLRYANNSNNDTIRKECYVDHAVIEELLRIVEQSTIMEKDDKDWPLPDNNEKEELEVVLHGKHISFMTTRLHSLLQVQSSKDPEGLKAFYYLTQDIKALALTLLSVYFKSKPV